MAPKPFKLFKRVIGGHRSKASETSNSKHDNDQQGSPATSSTSLPTPSTGMKALPKSQKDSYPQSLAKVEHSPLEQTMYSTAQPASSPQQVTSAGSPSPTASSNQPALHGTHTSPTLPEQSRTTAVPSLWDRAYEALRKEDRQLVDNYEKLLSRELEKTSMYQQRGLSCCR
jgi:hypothetical protein